MTGAQVKVHGRVVQVRGRRAVWRLAVRMACTSAVLRQASRVSSDWAAS